MEAFIGGLPRSIEGNVTASKPQTLEEDHYLNSEVDGIRAALYVARSTLQISSFRKLEPIEPLQELAEQRHLIDSQGLHVDPVKIEAVKNWASPNTPTEIRQFLGLAGYYQRFIEVYCVHGPQKPSTYSSSERVKHETTPLARIARRCALIVRFTTILEGKMSLTVLRAINLSSRIVTLHSHLDSVQSLQSALGYSIRHEYGTYHPRKLIGKVTKKHPKNSNYHASIKATPFKALYGRRCRSPVYWTEVGDVQFTRPEIIHETTEKIVQIRQRLQAARDWKRSYANVRRRPLEFQVRDRVMLKVSPRKDVIRFGKRGKLNPRYIGPFKILEQISSVAYKLELPEELRNVHNTFHVSNLRKMII
ncbi:hypothetical protein Tco_1018673 [Tanacetum coccineum]|uniref:Tf2-1-like SH3-like domain-containing protein n=1 Tax=Tanacetum coccineum TaxID=301880 RepID=A0ABQ5FWE7_9ASTR